MKKAASRLDGAGFYTPLRCAPDNNGPRLPLSASRYRCFAKIPGGVQKQRGNAMHIVLFRFLFDESGATAIEYALIASGIALAIVSAVSSVGSSMGAKFDTISTAMQ